MPPAAAADGPPALSHLTQFTQDGGSAINNEELTCVFQGISNEGAYYVSADFHVTHPSLPASFETPHHPRDDYTKDRLHVREVEKGQFNPRCLPSGNGWLR